MVFVYVTGDLNARTSEGDDYISDNNFKYIASIRKLHLCMKKI